ncbi:MAG: GntR family transcriptional regulator [Cyanobacteria bacterium P01_G01_bin.19]
MSKPIYLQIAEELKSNIQQQSYLPGDKLPTEKNLADRFQVNRHTVRNAIAILKEEGLIRVDRGRGMYVAQTPIGSLEVGKKADFLTVHYDGAVPMLMEVYKSGMRVA